MVEFMVNHRNILIAQFYHTSGGFTYVPPGTGPHTNVPPKDRAIFDFVMGKKYLEVNGMEVPDAWQNPQNLPQIKEELAKAQAQVGMPEPEVTRPLWQNGAFFFVMVGIATASRIR